MTVFSDSTDFQRLILHLSLMCWAWQLMTDPTLGGPDLKDSGMNLCLTTITIGLNISREGPLYFHEMLSAVSAMLPFILPRSQ